MRGPCRVLPNKRNQRQLLRLSREYMYNPEFTGFTDCNISNDELTTAGSGIKRSDNI